MKRLDRVLIDVTVGELRAWIREKHPDLPADCLTETRTLLAPDVFVAGMVPDDQVALVAISSMESES
jgi:hypothetical protein